MARRRESGSASRLVASDDVTEHRYPRSPARTECPDEGERGLCGRRNLARTALAGRCPAFA
ncbi:hypothetical protein MINT15_36070 [Saccharomonospora viridis]|uniref:Uncharacterized protein n=1 Tax=Saccharomonospora viridis TaxID=1852 RepID=A0A837D862_9PSEU|nr:hypothetical protein MINT15_36070 [Saccharomonospora viridis]